MDAIQPKDCDDLIVRYLEVCNRALVFNCDRFPFKQILGAAKQAERNRLIEVDVIDVQPKTSYVMNIERGRIVAKPHGDCEDCNCDRSWPVTVSYLKDVVSNPEAHIENPAIIDWSWMYDVDRG